MSQDFECFLRIEVDLVEHAINLVLDDYNSILITYEIPPGISSFENFCEVLSIDLRIGSSDASHSINIENEDISMKTKLVVNTKI